MALAQRRISPLLGERRSPPAAWALACVAVVGGLAGVWITARGGYVGVVAGTVLVVCSAVALLARLRTDKLDGPGWYGLLAAVFFGLMSLQWLGTPPLTAPGITRDDVSRALLLVAGGLLVFALGARVVGPATARRPLQYAGDDARRRLHLIVALFVFGTAGTVVGIASGTVGYTADAGSAPWRAFSQVFVQLTALGGLAVLACSLQAFGARDPRARRALPVLIAVQVVVGFAAGFKGQAVLPLVFAALAFVSCSGRVPWRPIIVGAAMTVVAVVPANIAYRSVLRPSPDAPVGNVRDLAENARHLIFLRYRLIDHLALIDARTPETYPYAGGRRYAQLPALVLVPRALWPDKPVLQDSLEFSHTYWEVPQTVTTSTPLTQPGDLLRNFGPVGVPVGLGVWGMIVAIFTRICLKRRSPRAEMIYIASLVSWITFVESDLPQLIAAAFRSVPVAIVVAWLLLPGRHQDKRTHSGSRAERVPA